jgi:hypothetical protein
MRSIVLALVLSACAHSAPGAKEPINIAAVRHEIDDAIDAKENDRQIHSMGAVRAQSAVVFTTADDGTQSEETWTRVNGGWQLQTRTALK